MSDEMILARSSGGVTTLTLNRPGQRNAVCVAMVRELEQACNRLEDESEDRAVVLRGAGEHFSVGIDLLDFPPDQKPDVRGFSRWERACRTLERLPMVILAAIDGDCVGGGLQLALTCDVRVATERAVFCLPEVKDGFLPGMGTFRLAKYIGLGRARRMALSGRRIDAEEALRIGLIDKICPEEGLDAAVAQTLAELEPINPVAVQLTRRLFDESFEIPYEEFIGCFLAAQDRAIKTDPFGATVRKAHAEKE